MDETFSIRVHRISGDGNNTIARLELVDSEGFSRAVMAVGDAGTWDQSVESALRKFERKLSQIPS